MTENLAVLTYDERGGTLEVWVGEPGRRWLEHLLAVTPSPSASGTTPTINLRGDVISSGGILNREARRLSGYASISSLIMSSTSMDATRVGSSASLQGLLPAASLPWGDHLGSAYWSLRVVVDVGDHHFLRP